MHIDTLNIYVGSTLLEPYIEAFCRTYAGSLQSSAIAYPDTRLDKASHYTFPTHSAYFLGEQGVPPSPTLFAEKIRQIEASLPENINTPVSLCLNHSAFAYYSNEQFRRLAYFFRRQLNARRIRVFYVAMRQDREMESLWAQFILKTTSATRLTTTLRHTELEPFSHTNVLHALQTMLSPDITFMVSDGSDADIQRCLQGFAHWLGVGESVKKGVDINLPLCRMLVTPCRKVLDFVQAMQPVMAQWPQDIPRPQWQNESALLSHTLPYGQKCPSYGWYLRKQERDMFLSSYTADNALLVQDNRLLTSAPSLEAFLHVPQQEMSLEHTRLERADIIALLETLQPQTHKHMAAVLKTLPLTQQGRTLRLCSNVLCPESYTIAVRGKRPRPKVTVLTLTYNHQDFIEQNIRGVCAQETSFPVEHIILDNFSTDDTPSLIQKYAENNSHIIPLCNLPDPTAALFSMVDSEYVCLCDGDDYFTDPEKLRLQAAYLDAHPECALCFHTALVHYEDGSAPDRLHPVPEHFSQGKAGIVTLEDMLNCNFMQTSTVMYRWRFIKGLPDWFCSFLEPADWYWHLLHAEVGSIGYIDRVMSVYRRHKNALYADSEQNLTLHRQRTGLRMLETLFMLNIHFKECYAASFTHIALPIFSDFARESQQQGHAKQLKAAVRQYPAFAKSFYEALKGLPSHA